MVLNKKYNDQGFASIVITLIVMSLVVLISIGFVRVVNREQRAAIDRQLSTQAFYAAETGINDAAQLLKDDAYLSSLGSTGKEDCDVSDSSRWAPLLDDSIEYTCILIDPQPEDLVYDSITNDVRVIYLRSDSVIGGLNIDWQTEPEPENPSFPVAGTNFPSTWGTGAGVLRVSLTPLSSVSRDSLIHNTFTVYLRPFSAGLATVPSAINYFSGQTQVQNQGQILQSPCHRDKEPMFCRASITGLNDPGGYLMTVRSIYQNSSFRVSSTLSGVQFRGEQAIVDSTGRASDVLRRIQTRLRLRDDYPYPGFSLQAGNDSTSESGVCKSYEIYPTFGSASEQRCEYLP